MMAKPRMQRTFNASLNGNAGFEKESARLVPGELLHSCVVGRIGLESKNHVP